MMPGGDDSGVGVAEKSQMSHPTTEETSDSAIMNTDAKPKSPSRKFITEAVRSPETILGRASDCIIPQYLFSEKKGKRTPLGVGSNDDCQGNDERDRSISRLALEVKEAVDSDPLHGKDWIHNLFFVLRSKSLKSGRIFFLRALLYSNITTDRFSRPTAR